MNIWVLMRPLISFTYCRQKPQNQADFVPQLLILKSPRGDFNEVSTITKVTLPNSPILGIIDQVKLEIEQNPPSKPLPESPNLSLRAKSAYSLTRAIVMPAIVTQPAGT